MTALPSLHAVKAEVERLAAAVGAPQDRLPSFGRTTDGGQPHIEAADDRYDYVTVERGEELERTSYHTLDELLYRILKDATFSVAGQFEQAHRMPGQDWRRLLFAEQVRLMGLISSAWGERLDRDIREALVHCPYVDE